MEEPSAFHTVYKSFDLVSVVYAGKSPPCKGHIQGAGQSGGLGDEVESLQVIPLIEVC